MIRRGRSAPKDENPFEWLRTEQLIPLWRTVQRQLQDEWHRVAAQTVRNPTMLARLQAATRIVKGDVRNGELVKFEFGGMWGPAIEFGWAPTGSRFDDGVGQYDGAYHDMRTLLLGDGAERRAVRITHSLSDKVPTHGNVSPLQYLVSRAQMSLTPAAQGKRTDKFYRTHTDPPPSSDTVETRRGRVANVLRDVANRDAADDPRRGRFVQVPRTYLEPNSKRQPGLSTVDYATSILRRMTVSAARERGTAQHFGAKQGLGGNVASVVRTVSRTSGNPMSWRTRGIPPANTLDRIGPIAHEILSDVLRGE